jgi:hypothetical protein
MIANDTGPMTYEDSTCCLAPWIRYLFLDNRLFPSKRKSKLNQLAFEWEPGHQVIYLDI